MPAPSHRTSRAFGFVSNETRHWKHSKQITYGSAVHQKTAFKVSTRSIAYQQPMRDNARVPTAFTASDFEKSVRDVDTELCSIAYKRIYALSFIQKKSWSGQNLKPQGERHLCSQRPVFSSLYISRHRACLNRCRDTEPPLCG